MEWVAVYKDGSSLPQFTVEGTENKYTDIDRSNLSKFCIYVK
jgi:hypothetical protein